MQFTKEAESGLSFIDKDGSFAETFGNGKYQF